MFRGFRRDIFRPTGRQHDRFARSVSDRTAFMLLGKLFEDADTTEIFTNPQCKETEDYITGRFG